MITPLHIAHRGGAGLWPENTLVAFEHAIRAKADGIELDVHLTRDGVLVVHHDESLKPAIARGPDGAWLERPTPLIKDLSFSELQAFDVGRLRPGARYSARYPEQQSVDGARIPALDEVFTLAQREAGPGFRLYVELKTALLDLSQSADPVTLAQAAVALIRRRDIGPQTIFVSFDWRTLVEAKRLAPDIANAFTTPPFYSLDPDDPSALHDTAEEARFRAAAAVSPAAGDTPWMAGLDWRGQPGTCFAEKMLRAIQAGGGNGWFAWHGDVTAETMTLARRLGLCVSCWTVDEPQEMQRLAALGVEAILTDRPDVLARTLG